MNHTHSHHHRLALIGLLLIGLVVGLVRQPEQTTLAQGGGTVSYGSKVFGTISPTAPPVRYTFTGAADDIVTIIVDSWSGALDLEATLIAPNGLVLARSERDTHSGDPLGAYLSVVLPQAGVYVLHLNGLGGTAGDFLLTLLGQPAPESTELLPGEPVEVTVVQNGPAQYFDFEALRCPTTLLVTDISPGQPFTFPFVVKVLDQRGQSVAMLRGGEQIQDWVTVQPLSGRYSVEVRGADPTAAGTLRLLVTCADEAPGCPTGQSGVAGVPLEGGGECPPCFDPDVPNSGGGCPDLNLRITTIPGVLGHVLAWDPMPGAEGYVVWVYGLISGGGEVYLTHATWVPGDPTHFTWILPEAGYVGYRFVLHVMMGDDVICVQEVTVPLLHFDPLCPDLGLTAVVTDEAVNAVQVNWAAGLGADSFDLMIYAIDEGVETYAGMLPLGGDATGRFFDHFPPELEGVRFILRMYRGDLICTAEVTVTFHPNQYVCPDPGLSVAALDPVERMVTLAWTDIPGGSGYGLDVYCTDVTGAESFIDSIAAIPAGVATTGYNYPEGCVGFRFVLRLLGWPIECSDEVVLWPQNPPGLCADFTLTTTIVSESQIDLAWTPYPGADGYLYLLTDDLGNPIPGHSVIMPSTQLSLTLNSPPIEPGNYIVRISPWDDMRGAICGTEAPIVFSGPPGGPCAIRTMRADVPVRLGPGFDRAVFTFLPFGMDILVIGFANDAAGNRWWQIDKTVIPGHEAVIALWVLAEDVEESGNCQQVPPGDNPPPVVPGEPEEPEIPPPGGWLPCGSCDTCGHPANECVTSPEGLCLWDPATCVAPPPEEPEEPGETCYRISVTYDPGRCQTPISAMLDTVPNCAGGLYLAGTTINAHAVAVDPKCNVEYWSGCASGTENSISFTATRSCTLTAHMHVGP